MINDFEIIDFLYRILLLKNGTTLKVNRQSQVENSCTFGNETIHSLTHCSSGKVESISNQLI
jgi:hypothetical protein